MLHGPALLSRDEKNARHVAARALHLLVFSTEIYKLKGVIQMTGYTLYPTGDSSFPLANTMQKTEKDAMREFKKSGFRGKYLLKTSELNGLGEVEAESFKNIKVE